MNKFHNVQKKLLVFFIISFFIFFILMQSVSKSIWDLLPIYNNFQFSYRLLILEVFISSIIAAIVVQKIPNKKLLIVLCIFTILNWGNRRTIKDIDDKELKKWLPISSAQGEGLFPAMPYWTNPTRPFKDKIPSEKINVISGNAQIKNINSSSTKHEYQIQVNRVAKIRENTLYFPGWILLANNKEVPIDYLNKKNEGIITFDLPKGEYNLILSFNDTPIRKLSKLISVVTAITLILFSIYKLILPSFINHKRK